MGMASMRLLAFAVLGLNLLGAASCADDPDFYLRVAVTGSTLPAGTVLGQMAVDVTVSGQNKRISVPSAMGSFSLPTAFTIQLPASASGRADVAIEAFSNNMLIARGIGILADVRSGMVTVALAPVTPTPMNTGDMPDASAPLIDTATMMTDAGVSMMPMDAAPSPDVAIVDAFVADMMSSMPDADMTAPDAAVSDAALDAGN